MYQKINNEQGNNTVPDTKKKKNAEKYEPPTPENVNTTQPNNAQPNNPKQTISQEQKVNIENIKGIMNSENTTSSSLRNIE